MTQIFSPNHEVLEPIFSKVIYKRWPKEYFNNIRDISIIKKFYNDCYITLEELLNVELHKYHPASWVLEGYEQLELWTIIFHQEKHRQIKGKREFAAYGRYGWKYVIEKSLERLAETYEYTQLKPTLESKNKVFTILTGMMQASEFSNYLHYLKGNLQSAELIFSLDLIRRFPMLSESDHKFFEKVQKLIKAKIDWTKYKNFAPNNDLMQQKVNDFLIINFSISIEEIEIIIKAIISEVLNDLGVLILVQPLEDFINIINVVTGISKEKIKTLINLGFLNTENALYESRDFLRKSQQLRMLYHAGVVVRLDSNFESIYHPKDADQLDVVLAKEHIIVSPRLLAEWLDVFVTRLVLGQRNDLKRTSLLRNEIGEIERFYRIQVFESEIKKMLEAYGFRCFNLSKIDNKPIECGEIDIIACSPKINAIYIIECKALAPVVDARAMGQVINDHYNQKQYHQKFLRKIKWSISNLEILKSMFFNRFSLMINQDVSVNSFFITSSETIISLIEENYTTITFYAFERFIKAETRKP